jgi:hypothetical protein
MGVRVAILVEPFVVEAIWDPEAGVWVAQSRQIIGLVTEAPTMEALLQKLEDIVPVLLEANGQAVDLDEAAYAVTWKTLQTAKLHVH